MSERKEGDFLYRTRIGIVHKPLSLEEVRVKETGNIIELMHMTCKNRRCHIQKLDDEQYVDLKTGEVKEFVHMDSRADDLNGVRVSLARLRDYLNTNITDVTRCRWVTLTYAQPHGKPMTDTDRLYKDFKKFVMRFHYRYGAFEYIVAMEPQGSGSWHAHVVFIFPGKAPYIPNDEMAKIWGQGFTKTRRLDNVDNVGAYLTAYLGDMEIHEFCNLEDHPSGLFCKDVDYIDDDGKEQKKTYVKGGRIHLYPPNFNLYRCSRGIKKPVVSYMQEKDAEKKVSAATLTFQQTVVIEDPDTGFENDISYRYYNSERK